MGTITRVPSKVNKQQQRSLLISWLTPEIAKLGAAVVSQNGRATPNNVLFLAKMDGRTQTTRLDMLLK